MVCLIGAVLAAVTGHLVLELMLLGLAAVTFVINAVLGGTDRRA